MKSVTYKLGTIVVFASLLAACGGGGGGGGGSLPGPVVTPTPTPVPSSTPALGALCLTPGQSYVRSPQSISSQPELHVLPSRASTEYVPDQVSVLYSRQTLAQARTTAAVSIDSGSGATVLNDVVFERSDKAIRTLRVDPSKIDATIASLKSRPGVLGVERVAVRHLLTTTPYAINDPYFAQPIPPSPPTPYVRPTAPYFESPSVPGQWDMHAIGLEYAMGYANAPFNKPMALGNPAVKIAMIDTGVDTTIKEFSGGKIVYTKCFVNGSTSSDVTDFDGHGTNTASTAAGDTNNSYAFAAAGGNVSIMAYRIFDNKGNASTADEEAAIADAVKNGANVISMSLGGGGMDPLENTAVQNAISAGVTVVAASGNESKSSLDYPAGYSGVVAVGATALVDANPGGVGTITTGTPYEVVATYSNWVPGSNSWGLVAPGGDPNPSKAQLPFCPAGSTGDCDDLHWIEGAYSTRGSPPCSAGSLANDFFGETGNCRVLIAGTSMATPHVAGAVGLLLSVSPGLSPAQVKSALFASAHSINNNDPKQGAGRLNMYKLIGTAVGDSNTPDQ